MFLVSDSEPAQVLVPLSKEGQPIISSVVRGASCDSLSTSGRWLGCAANVQGIADYTKQIIVQ